MLKNIVKYLQYVSLIVFLTGCGAGGLGAGASLSSSTNELNFEGIVGKFIPIQSIELALKGSGSVYTRVSSSHPSIATGSLSFLGPVAATLSVNPASGLAAGEYTSTITVDLYSDESLRSRVGGSSFPVRIKIHSLDFSPKSLSFSLLEGAADFAFLSHPNYASLPAKISQATVSSRSNIKRILTLETSAETGTIKVIANTVGVPTGIHTEFVDVDFVSKEHAGEVGSVSVMVQVHVGPVLVTPLAQSLTVSASSTQASLSGSVPIVKNGTGNGSWTATSSAPWLVLSSNAGVFPAQLGYSVDLQLVRQLDLTKQHDATVTISSPDLVPVQFIVDLSSKLPLTFTALPVGIKVGVNQQVNVGGNGFSHITDPMNQVSVPGAQVTSVQIVSDKLMRLDLVVPASGAYPVIVPSMAGVSINSAKILAAQSLILPPSVEPITPANYIATLWDPMQGAVFLLDDSGSMLTRMKFNAGAWQSSSIAIPNPKSMALSPNTGNLFVMNISTVFELDTGTLAILNQYPVTSGNISYQTRSLLPVSLEGDILLPANKTRFNINRKIFREADLTNPNFPIDYGSYYGSADGSLMLLSSYFPGNTSYIVVGTNQGNWIPVSGKDFIFNTKISANGNEILTYEGKLFDRAFNLLGTLPSELASDWSRIKALTPDGSKILVVTDHYQDSTRTNFVSRTMDAYLTSAFVPGTNQFQKITSVSMNSVPSTCGTSTFICYGGELFITAEGMTAIWVSENYMQIMAVP